MSQDETPTEMKSIYNKYLAIEDEDFRRIYDQFYETVKSIFDDAKEKNLNFREVSHQLVSMVCCVESDFTLSRACQLRKQEEDTKNKPPVV